ncbi:hypothetical protein [Marinobacterium rhizophilum]|uniref:DUF2845 domain-containing protein n=1 Tax=Marinobacterium rhizophilum TaxID=420402 RepID=A0ABY5HNZ8_9GAMM|nr:hypothetical protein [Marinobacterium rhizophilum]UTW13601.1 hypothetical protein KDW95_08170 [Marinobacterium rhizophilum]
MLLLLLSCGLFSGPTLADQLHIRGKLFRDGDSVIQLLQHAGQPLWVSPIGYRCSSRFDRRHYRRYERRHGHDRCRYRLAAERWTYIDAGKEIRVTIVDDTIDAIDWKFKGHSW